MIPAISPPMPKVLASYPGKYGVGTKKRPPTVLSALFSLSKATDRSATSDLPAVV